MGLTAEAAVTAAHAADRPAAPVETAAPSGAHVVTTVPAPAAPYSAPHARTPSGPDGAPVAAADAGPAPAALDGADELQLSFSDKSWVEIQDGAGQRVFYDMGEPGETRTVHGTAPFKILLGYSPGVSIEYNGAPFDQTPYSSRNHVARFSVGG